MTRLVGPSMLLLVALCSSSSQDKVNVEVLYPKRTFTVKAGSSIRLVCNINYLALCGTVHAVWRHSSTELTDPGRYLTTVNETVSDDIVRRRQVVTEILHLSTDDTGEFQCEATCESGENSVGHAIQIIVKG